MGNFTRLKLTHLIPKERVQEEYLLRMMEGQELAWALLGLQMVGCHSEIPIFSEEDSYLLPRLPCFFGELIAGPILPR